MKLTQNNRSGYLQVIISFFIIYGSYCLSSFKIGGDDYLQNIGLYHLIRLTDKLPLLDISGEDEWKMVLGYFALILLIKILLLIHVVNIFIQSKKKNTAFAIISGTYTLLCLFATYFIILSFRWFNIDDDVVIKPFYAFYLIALLAIAQIATSIFVSNGKNNAEADIDIHPTKDNNYNTVKAPSEKELLEEELRQLQAQVKQIEKEQAKRKYELEKAQKEKIEKENLINEIAKLKEFIKNNQNNQ